MQGNQTVSGPSDRFGVPSSSQSLQLSERIINALTLLAGRYHRGRCSDVHRGRAIVLTLWAVSLPHSYGAAIVLALVVGGDSASVRRGL